MKFCYSVLNVLISVSQSMLTACFCCFKLKLEFISNLTEQLFHISEFTKVGPPEKTHNEKTHKDFFTMCLLLCGKY